MLLIKKDAQQCIIHQNLISLECKKKNARKLQNALVLGLPRLSDQRWFEEEETLCIKNNIKKFQR